jgi:hypothetical protein
MDRKLGGTHSRSGGYGEAKVRDITGTCELRPLSHPAPVASRYTDYHSLNRWYWTLWACTYVHILTEHADTTTILLKLRLVFHDYFKDVNEQLIWYTYFSPVSFYTLTKSVRIRHVYFHSFKIWGFSNYKNKGHLMTWSQKIKVL